MAKKRGSTKKRKLDVSLREALIEEGLAFLTNHRVEDLSLRLLAKNIGVSHMAPYRHFQNKEDLLAAIVASGFSELTNRFRLATSGPLGFWEEFYSLGKAYVEFVIDNPDHARLMFSGLIYQKGKYPEAQECGDKAFRFLIEMVYRGQKMGYLNADHPLQMAFAIWSMVHGYASLLLERQFDDMHGFEGTEDSNVSSVESMMAYMVTIMKKGIASSKNF
jgi:AcrR family transcriptional regulator